MRWLFVVPLRPFVLLAAGASLLLNLAMLMPSLFMLQVFDRVFASRSVPTLLMLCALTLLALAFAYSMDVARSRALATAGDALHRGLSPALLEHGLHDAAAGAPRGTESLRDVARLSGFLGSAGVRALFDAPWVPIYLLVIGLMHPLLAVAAGVGALALGLLALVTERITREGSESTQRGAQDSARDAEAMQRHAETLAAMGMTGNIVAGWRDRHHQVLDARRSLAMTSSRLAAVARVLRQGVQVVVLALGAWLVIDANASPGIMVAATILLGRALQPVEQLIGGWKQLADARSAWRRLSQSATTGEPTQRLTLPAPAGRLALERVVYAHERSQPATIKGISFALSPGESLGIVGPSGSGKSTLARLMLGLRTPNSGNVRLDGADIAQWNRDDLGAHVGYLPQDATLLPGTIAGNIARLGALDNERVVAAARLAQVHELILRLPEGYETRAGHGAAKLSGGQVRRIALARALYGDPALVVLDEPEAHLDAEGLEALTAALHALKARGATVVVVGHRLGLMAQLDRIAVIAEGSLQAFGPAAAVLARSRGANVHPLATAKAVTA